MREKNKMKFIIFLGFLFVLPFIPIWMKRIQNYLHHEERKRLKIEDALKILELQPEPSEEEIKAAHKRLIQKNHPDAGGSPLLASKINEARDVLLKNLKS